MEFKAGVKHRGTDACVSSFVHSYISSALRFERVPRVKRIEAESKRETREREREREKGREILETFDTIDSRYAGNARKPRRVPRIGAVPRSLG